MKGKDHKDCGNHGFGGRLILSRICACILALIVLVLFVVLVLYLVLHPHKPKFYLQDATVRAFNLTGPSGSYLTTEIQITVLSHNPNDRISVLYGTLTGYALYYGQPITGYCTQPPLYQGHKGNLLLPFQLSGVNVPIAPLLLNSLNYEQRMGLVNVNLVINGRVRWKVGLWTSGHYHINIDCNALLGTSGGGTFSNGVISLQPGSNCDVDV